MSEFGAGRVSYFFYIMMGNIVCVPTQAKDDLLNSPINQKISWDNLALG